MGSYWLGTLGLAVLASGLISFFFPKPPPLGFEAFLGANRRLYVALVLIVAGGVMTVLGFYGR